ncbi:MAG: hypothetical protein R2795_09240 [Saprospiraceae bacterium]
MAKFRRNHADASKQSGGMIAKVGIFGAIVGGLYFLFNMFAGGEISLPGQSSTPETEPSAYAGEAHFLPSKVRGSQIYHYTHYSISYNEDFEQADWVAYMLTADNLNKPWGIAMITSDPTPPFARVALRPMTIEDRGTIADISCLLPIWLSIPSPWTRPL